MSFTHMSTACLSLLFLTKGLNAADNPPEWSKERGTWRYHVASPHITGTNLIEVLLPKSYDNAGKYRVVYVLPVEPKEEHRFGDAMQAMVHIQANNAYNLIVVCLTFDIMPWYGNHASDAQCHQEDYLMQTVIPLIERKRSAVETSG